MAKTESLATGTGGEATAEDQVPLVHGDANAVIANFQDQVIPFILESKADATRTWRHIGQGRHGVADQVHQDLENDMPRTGEGSGLTDRTVHDNVLQFKDRAVQADEGFQEI